jgi:D-amino-acid oxidase
MNSTSRKQNTSPIVVVGCGVIGLTTSIRLLEQGHAVTIVTRDIPPHTTSNVAAAVWFPYHVMPLERVLVWSAISLDTYYELSSDYATGISLTTFIDLFESTQPDPWWREAVRHYRRPTAEELPEGFADGHLAEVPLIETPVHMNWLVERFNTLGGQLVRRELNRLDEVPGKNDVVINCSGLGARLLVDDESVYPIRGQIARVTRPPSVIRVLFDEHGRHALGYVIPRRNEVIVGGTAQENNWDLLVDPATADLILQKGMRLSPELRGAQVIDHLVGLRPGRTAVRLEMEQLAHGRTVIHNYGHGGAGFTLSWGCAAEVVDLVEQILTAGR